MYKLKAVEQPITEAHLRYSKIITKQEMPLVVINTPECKDKISIPISKEDKIPISGLFLGENVFQYGSNQKINTALCIGTGKYAPIEFYLVALWGATLVDGIEINQLDALYARKNIDINNLSGKIKIYEGNMYEPVKNKTYDLIISNIAQMPAKSENEKSQHDYGGKDGWYLLDRVLNNCKDHLNDCGFVSLLIFDFLGVNHRNSSNIPSLSERFEANNLRLINMVSYRRRVREGGITHKSLDYILQTYDGAKFYDKGGNVINKPSEVMKNVSKGLYFDTFVVTGKLD